MELTINANRTHSHVLVDDGIHFLEQAVNDLIYLQTISRVPFLLLVWMQ